MAAARYLVVYPPGAQVEQLGFVKAGQSFEAPRKDYIPSRRFRAMNQEAVDGLLLLQALILEEAEKYGDKLKEKNVAPDDYRAAAQKRGSLKDQAASIDLNIFGPPVETENVRDEVSLHELGEAALASDKSSWRASDGA
jgi:hypothetical protein